MSFQWLQIRILASPEMLRYDDNMMLHCSSGTWLAQCPNLGGTYIGLSGPIAEGSLAPVMRVFSEDEGKSRRKIKETGD